MDLGPRPGSRDNGLRAARYVAVADLDPRIADALLSALRDEGIAAYAAPTPAVSGGYMELRLPSRPIDRLWVDESGLPRARALVAAEEQTGPAETDAPRPEEAPTPDLESAWQDVLASLQSKAASPVPPWPVSEDVDPTAGEGHVVRPAAVEERALGDDEEHFVPPPAPPLPRLQPATLLAVAAILLGLLILVTQYDGGSLNVLGVALVIGGTGTLVYRMRQGPPTDSGWDDGAVV